MIPRTTTMIKNILLLLIVLPLLAGCSGGNKDLREKLQNAVEADDAGTKGFKTIELTKLTDFEWDTAYFFQASETARDISDRIGYKWDGSDVPDWHNRLLFVKGGKVVSYTDYNYQEFPLRVFGCNTDQWVYPRSRSRFASFKYCQNVEPVYTFIPEPCLRNIRELMADKCPDGKAVK